MSGGVDSAVAALHARREGEAVAVTLELWSDRENDAERSCCSASAVAQARALAHRMGLPHFTARPARRVPRRRRRAVHRRLRGGGDAESLRRLQRPRPARRDARRSPIGSAATRSPPATTRATAEHDHPAGPLLRVAADPAKDQSYMLAALSPESLARMRFPLGELTKPETRALAARGGAAGGEQGRLAGPVLPRRHRPRPLPGPPRRPGRAPRTDRRPSRRRRSAEHRGHHRFTVGQRKGIGLAGGRAAVRARQGRRAQPGHRRARARRSERSHVTPARRAPAPRRRAGSTASSCATDRSRCGATLTEDAGPGEHAVLGVELAEPVYGAAPGQLACLMDGEIIVGRGTIARR